jgi:hypothetical protein
MATKDPKACNAQGRLTMGARRGEDLVSDRWSVAVEEFGEEMEEPEEFVERLKK